MLTLEYKIDATLRQYATMDEAIRTTQFLRNKCLRHWMDADREQRIDEAALHAYTAQLASEFAFAARLGSQARQAAASRAWYAIERFYQHCQQKKPGKKGYPQFQHDCRSVEYKTAGWKLSHDGRHLTFTDGNGIGRVRLVGKKATGIAAFLSAPVIEAGKDYTPDELAHLPPDDLDAASLQPIKRVRIVRRADGYFCQFCVDTQWEVPHQPTGVDRGIDVGLNAYYTDSEGHKEENPLYLRQSEQRLKRLQRRASRKSVRHQKTKKPKAAKKRNQYPKGLPVVAHQHRAAKPWHTQARKPKTLRRQQRRAAPPSPPRPPVVQNALPPAEGEPSQNYQKARKQLARLHLRIQRQREDHARKTACALVSSSDVIAYEDLQIANLLRNHKLAKRIADASWGRFLHWVRYYARQQGIACIAVPPQFTSQDCSGVLPDGSRCRERVHKSLSVRTHICPRCGLVLDRDHNSGKLILERALSVPSGRRERAHSG